MSAKIIINGSRGIFAKAENDTMTIKIRGVIGDSELYDTDCTKLADEVQDFDGKTIHVQIASYGGGVYAGLELYTALKMSSAEVITMVTAHAQSMGAILAMAGNKRLIAKQAKVMIHKASTWMWGNADDMREQAETLDLIDELLLGIINDATGGVLDKMPEKDMIMSAEDAVAQGYMTGFIDYGDDDDDDGKAQNSAQNKPLHGNIDEVAYKLLAMQEAGVMGRKPSKEQVKAASPVAVSKEPAREDTTMTDETKDDIKAAAEEAAKAERQRVTDITTFACKFGVERELVDKAITDGLDMAAAAKMFADSAPDQEPAPRVEVGKDYAEDKIKADISKLIGEPRSSSDGGPMLPVKGSCDEVGVLASALNHLGVDTSGMRDNEVVNAAVTSTHLLSIASTQMNTTIFQSLKPVFDELKEFVDTEENTNFHDVYGVRFGGAGHNIDSAVVAEGADYDEGAIRLTSRPLRARKMGRDFRLTREAVARTGTLGLNAIVREVVDYSWRAVAVRLSVIINNTGNWGKTFATTGLASDVAVYDACLAEAQKDGFERPHIIVPRSQWRGLWENVIAPVKNEGARENVLYNTCRPHTDLITNGDAWVMLMDGALKIAWADSEGPKIGVVPNNSKNDDTVFRLWLDFNIGVMDLSRIYGNTGV